MSASFASERPRTAGQTDTAMTDTETDTESELETTTVALPAPAGVRLFACLSVCAFFVLLIFFCSGL